MTPESEELFKSPIEELLSESGYLPERKWHIAFYKIMLQLNSTIDHLRNSMEQNTSSSNELAEKVHRLNIILTWATVVASLAAVAAAVVAVIQLLQQLNYAP
jgi:predicted DNA-binding ArsR family transcriptional regulator